MKGTHSYPNVYALGHAAIKELFHDDVLVEEKIDGSQFSFGLFEGELKCRSKNCEISPEYPVDMFADAVKTVLGIKHLLKDGWTYRCECLNKPKHNTLCYARVPKGNLILFDINTGLEDYMPPRNKCVEAIRLGLECVPVFYSGKIENYTQMKSFLDTESCLGKEKIEGMVFKNYKRFGQDKKVLMGKYVQEEFIEKNQKTWKAQGGKNVVLEIGESLRTEARWNKAIQHLKEKGELTNSPKDIGALLKEIGQDVIKECSDEIKDTLFKWAWKTIGRTITKGFPEWYKDKLAKDQFE